MALIRMPTSKSHPYQAFQQLNCIFNDQRPFQVVLKVRTNFGPVYIAEGMCRREVWVGWGGEGGGSS